MVACDYQPGLEGIPVAQSSISFVDGKQGILEYRGINIEELAQKKHFSRNRLFTNLG
jgi:citrate synthase